MFSLGLNIQYVTLLMCLSLICYLNYTGKRGTLNNWMLINYFANTTLYQHGSAWHGSCSVQFISNGH